MPSSTRFRPHATSSAVRSIQRTPDGRRRSPTRGRTTSPRTRPPGTYYLNVKGRRTYLGEDIAFSKTIEMQVGSIERTQPTLTTGRCTCLPLRSFVARLGQSCERKSRHVRRLSRPARVRARRTHLRANAFHPLALGSVRRAALPVRGVPSDARQHSADQQVGLSLLPQVVSALARRRVWPDQSIYVGGGRESFQQCTSSCHTTHPKSGL